MNKQPTALRLAEYLDAAHAECVYEGPTIESEAAAELRRLHALCQEMLSELYVYRASEHLKDVTAALKARNKATGEQA